MSQLTEHSIDSNESLANTVSLEVQEKKPNNAAEAFALLATSIAAQQDKGLCNGLPVGSKAKDFTLTDPQGNPVQLYEELSKGPVVLVFYRGGWCPYCNLQLRAYEDVLSEIQSLGAQLIAVSPQPPDHSLTQIEKEQLSFKVLSDVGGLTAARYNLLYEVPDYIQTLYQEFGMNLAEYNRTSRWIMPVPATFMIDEAGVIRSAYANPDFMLRMESHEILKSLRQL